MRQNPGVRRRVVVTGAGVVAAPGVGVETFWDALEQSVSGASILTVDGIGDAVVCAAPELEEDRFFSRREARRLDRCAQLSVAAARLALEDAGGDLGLSDERIGTSVGSAHGGMGTLDAAYRTLTERGADRVSPFTIPLSLTNHASAATARALGLHGPAFASCTACAAGADAIGAAMLAIRDGRADAMFAGGAEAPLSPLVIAGYHTLGALASTARGAAAASRPFDRKRDGFVIGEGAGLLVLEELEHARARGARIYAELVGYGSSCDAAHLTDPDESGDGPAAAMTNALADASLEASAIGYVNAHATSTPAGDTAEARAIRRAGLGHAAVSSTKSVHGHTLGAAGGIESIAALMPIVRGVMPPTVNLEDPDDDQELDHVAGTSRRQRAEAVVSSSFGFGGHNAALAYRALPAG